MSSGTRRVNNEFINWTISAIPYCEAIFLVFAMSFILTSISYDIHPLGCLIGPDEDAIRYENKSAKVILDFTQGLLQYQMIALSFFYCIYNTKSKYS